MKQRLFLGIDVSTTSAKALLIDPAGVVVASASTPLSISAPHPLWSEQDPHEWWEGVAASIRRALTQAGVHGAEVAAIGLTGQMHGLVLLDEQGHVLRPAILWNDQRTAQQCDEIRRRLGREQLIRITGNEALTGFTAPKILWVAEHEPALYAQARHILLPKDYIRYRLTGEYAMDKADGSGTLLFDLRVRDWSAAVTRTLDIPAEWLPPTFEGPQVTGGVSAEAALATGLQEGTPVVAGGGDQAAGAVGMGAIDPGTVSVTLGTSGVVFAPTAEPLIEPEGRLHAFCHALPGRWHLMGVMLSAAGSLQWYRDTLAPQESFESLVGEAATAPAGSAGLIFLPYLTGERTPYPDPLARGAWVGLTSRHRRAHLTRALLEGVAFGLKDSFGLLAAAGVETVQQVRVAGGGAKSTLWRQILADVLGVELATVTTTEGAAYGAALLAGAGVGAWPDVASACGATVQPGTYATPDQRTGAVYEDLYARYRELYPALRATNDALATLESSSSE
ncbi:MAG TPA: xylulokinase [Chloroflexia bacterium]|nr:xylulokinase [Chloroflexia bacterium]